MSPAEPRGLAAKLSTHIELAQDVYVVITINIHRLDGLAATVPGWR